MVVRGFFTRASKYLDADHQRLSPRGMLLFMLTGLILAGAALLSIVWLVVGWSPVLHEVRHIAWIWLIVAAGGTIPGHTRYLFCAPPAFPPPPAGPPATTTDRRSTRHAPPRSS